MFVRNVIVRVSCQLALVCCCLLANHSTASAANGLKSAFLGSSVWEEGLSSQEINQQVQDHFAEVIGQLEARNASSLLTALQRAEATSIQGWTKAQRKQALIALAKNRQTQIARLHKYAGRGLFPVNEGQSDRAAPIFVDRRKTHCAVGYLMHVDGHDLAVAEIVASDNLVRVMDAKLVGLSNWVRLSGLTREEAALIQPGYPIDINATLGELQSTKPVLNANGYTISETVVKHVALDSTLLAAPGNPVPLFWESGRAMLNAETTNATTALDNNGVKLGSGQFELGTFNSQSEPNNLSDWLYFGATKIGFGSIDGGLTPSAFSEDLQLFSLDYRISPDSGKFAQFALTSGLINGNSVDQQTELGALRILSEIYDGTSNQLLGSTELSLGLEPGIPPVSFLDQVQFLNLDADSLRIKTYGMKSGAFSFVNSIFHEFETVAVPEPSGLVLILSIAATAGLPRRRKR